MINQEEGIFDGLTDLLLELSNRDLLLSLKVYYMQLGSVFLCNMGVTRLCDKTREKDGRMVGRCIMSGQGMRFLLWDWGIALILHIMGKCSQNRRLY